MFEGKEIKNLAKITGYDPRFLKEIWEDMKKDGKNDFKLFKGITLELDW